VYVMVLTRNCLWIVLRETRASGRLLCVLAEFGTLYVRNTRRVYLLLDLEDISSLQVLPPTTPLRSKNLQIIIRIT